MPNALIVWRDRIEPQGLRRPRAVAMGAHARVYMTAADRSFRDELRLTWRLTRAVPPAPFAGPLRLELRFAGRSPHMPDVSNVLKAVEDAGNGVLWVDDAQLVDVRAVRVAWGRGIEPFMEVALWAWE